MKTIEQDWVDRLGIYTHAAIDLERIDPTLIPGVGTPELGGLHWYTLTTFLRRVFETHQVIGCDVMELAPVVDSVVSQFTDARLVYKLIGYHAHIPQENQYSMV